MTVSVIMSVYNEKPEWLRESIESILNQSYRDLEFIIVIDNPKREDLIAIVKEYSQKDDRVVFYINEKNMGLIFSLNRALNNANGRFIARMDADDISHTNRIEKQLKFLNSNSLDLVGSNINLFNEDGVFSTTNKLLTDKYIKKLLSLGTINIVHPTFFAKAEVFKKLNGYNKEALHVEDKDFLARAICKGYKVGNCKEVLLDCRYSKSSVTKTNAFYIHYVGSAVTKAFNNCLKSGNYELDLNFIKSLEKSKDKESFNNSKLLLSNAKEALYNKKLVTFVYNIAKALIIAPENFASVKINIIFKLLKLQENLELLVKRR